MTYQNGRDIVVALKQETAFGVRADPAGATLFRIASGGLQLGKATIQPNENRRDGMTTRPRHGARSLTGQYRFPLSLGSHDALIAAVFRSEFLPVLVITGATAGLNAITIGANTITAQAGSWIAAGLRVGDVFQIADLDDVGNLNRNLRITSLTDLVITTAETLVANATPDTSFTITRPRKLLQGKVARSFSVEEYEQNIDVGEISVGVRFGRLQIEMQPNSEINVTVSAVGRDVEISDNNGAPYFVDPDETFSLAMTAVEANIRLGNVDVVDVTALSIDINLNASGVDVVGSSVTPEVFTNNATMTGSVTMLTRNADRRKSFLAEEQLSLHLVANSIDELGGFCSFYLGNFTLGSATKSDIGADNGRTQTFDLLVGKDTRGGGFDATMIKYQTSFTPVAAAATGLDFSNPSNSQYIGQVV